MDKTVFNQNLLAFIQQSPTPFHAVKNMAKKLVANNFQQLHETDTWALEAGGKYFTTRNDSSLIAFVVGDSAPENTGIRMVGAHTDSPCLMVKPQPEQQSRGCFQLGVEVYGGALLNPWFDRDLSLAGRVVYKNTRTGQLAKTLINFKRPVAIIPSLAIHLDREANTSRSINSQTDIPPILFQVEADQTINFRELLAEQLLIEEVLPEGLAAEDVQVLDYELCCYDTQAPSMVGLREEFIASARLDNLLSCYVGLQALSPTDSSVAPEASAATRLLVCTDHEEVGSASACGAQGPFLQSVLERLVPNAEQRTRAIDRSLLISADNAHGIHPNYPALHDTNHGPTLNKGPVLKVNANQRYATNSITASLFRQWAERAEVPVQHFVTRSDLGCGSTIGPITSAGVGVPTLDVGVPTFAMHSIRELAGRDDAYGLYLIMGEFFQSKALDI